MQLKVGQILTFGGKNWLVTGLHSSESTEMFPLNSTQLREERSHIQNAKHLSLEIGEFEAHSVVDFEVEYAQLEVPHQEIFFIYTKYRATAHQETSNAELREESTPIETPDREAQSPA